MDGQRILFIGAGNMASAIIGGLIADGYAAHDIGATDIDADKLRALSDRFGVHTGSDNAAAADADVVVFAVKPQSLREVAIGLRPILAGRRPLCISIAAGIRLAALGTWLGADLPLVRAMPNTPALVGSGAAALVANDNVSEEQRAQAEAVMRAVGITVWLDDEALLDPVTAVSGSGPAYVFLLMEALQQAGIELGLPQAQARILTLQTVLGAARLALESDIDPAELRRQVTSPGGTTERALACLEGAAFRTLIADAVRAANARSQELASQFGGN